MRYAILSDIHANLQALEAVLADAAAERVGMRICLGDVVGYGPSPAETIDLVHRRVEVRLMGNHDAATAGLISTQEFNPIAAEGVARTRARLAPQDTAELASYRPDHAVDGFRCVHGAPVQPMAFAYIHNSTDAAACWKAFGEQLLFTGHTHRPAIFVVGDSGATWQLEAGDFTLEAGKRYIVNPGSVGMPRDDDLRASYCIFDSVEGSIRFRRIPFDLECFRESVQAAGLPEERFWFLAPGLSTPPFPASAKARMAGGTNRRAWLLGAAGVGILALGGLLLGRRRNPAPEPVSAPAAPQPEVPLPLPDKLDWTAGRWQAKRADDALQQVEFKNTSLHIRNAHPTASLSLVSRPIALPPRGFRALQLRHLLNERNRGACYSIWLEVDNGQAKPTRKVHHFSGRQLSRSWTFQLSVTTISFRIGFDFPAGCELELGPLTVTPKTRG